MVTPSRWFAGGKGLDDVPRADARRQPHAEHRRLSEALRGFPGVKIRGGISYFLWDRDHDGRCEIQHVWDGESWVSRRSLPRCLRRPRSPQRGRVHPRRRSERKSEAERSTAVSSRKPFGLRTNFTGKPTRSGPQGPVRLFGSQTGHLGRALRHPGRTRAGSTSGRFFIDSASRARARQLTTEFLSKPIIAEPGTACTETYLVAGRFDTEAKRASYATYLRTRSFASSSHCASPPRQRRGMSTRSSRICRWTSDWTDAKLYKRYSSPRRDRLHRVAGRRARRSRRRVVDDDDE